MQENESAEPMTDCVSPQFLDCGIIGLTVTKTPRHLYILFQGVSASEWRKCRFSVS